MNYLPVLDMIHNLALLMAAAYLFDLVTAQWRPKKIIHTRVLFGKKLLFSEVPVYRISLDRGLRE